jgi:RNA polymerase sigma-70 factor, ECF subfamily
MLEGESMRFDKKKVNALFKELGGGNWEALEMLYDECARTLYGYAFVHLRNREDSEDVVQEVFVKLMKTKAALKDVKNPQAYLLSMTHRAVVDLRRRPSDSPLDDEVMDVRDNGQVPVAEKIAINQAMCALSPEQRAAVYLKEVEGMSFHEIGSVTGTNLFTAASRYRLGLGRLKKFMEVSK